MQLKVWDILFCLTVKKIKSRHEASIIQTIPSNRVWAHSSYALLCALTALYILSKLTAAELIFCL